MTLKNHALFWSGIAFLLLLTLWALKSVLLPFVLGLAVAYLLNPMVNRLGELGLPRSPAALVILLVFFLVVICSFLIVGPILYKELALLSSEIPAYVDALRVKLEPHISWAQELMGQTNGEDITAFVQENLGSAMNVAQFVIGKIAAGSQAVLGGLTLMFLMPIVAFFMMKDWPAMTYWAKGLIPQSSKKDVNGLLGEIDTKIAGFVRGQLSVMMVLAVIYAIALAVVGLKYGFLIGVTAGLLSIIPMVGSVVGLLLAVLVALFQTGDLGFVALVAGIFITGQIFEGHVLTPKLVGDSVGLHPLWIIFALMAGGALFGITGMLLAVPVTAIIGVLIGYGLKRYKASGYYKKKAPRKKNARKRKTASA